MDDVKVFPSTSHLNWSVNLLEIDNSVEWVLTHV